MLDSYNAATIANFTCLAATRHAVLAQAGWDVEADGLFGAPEVAVVVGEEAHPTLFKSLGLAGFGRSRVVRVPVGDQGRMRADMFLHLSGPTIVCLRAGNVNTCAFDRALQIIPIAKAANAWVHVDGAFGLWAAAAPCKAHLMANYADADSWATDAHKYLNTPYDSGLAFLRSPDGLPAAMAISAAYLPASPTRDPSNFTPELSRRALRAVREATEGPEQRLLDKAEASRNFAMSNPELYQVMHDLGVCLLVASKSHPPANHLTSHRRRWWIGQR